MKIAIVIPCFNEEKVLETTCHTLGFGKGEKLTPTDVILVIVDNNSSDATRFIAKKVQAKSTKNSVYIISEKKQGFVPARHSGNLFVKKIAQARKWVLAEVLILQADADTHYGVNYIDCLRTIAKTTEGNVLFEACVTYPLLFQANYPRFIDLCTEIDNKFMGSFSSELSDDIIIDDKVAGYWLCDYFNWGGHKCEYNQFGEEIYAETTRMFMTAMAKGAKKIIVEDTIAFHSPRKVLENPALHIATAGFPRETAWKNKWNVGGNRSLSLPDFFSGSEDLVVKNAIETRKKHLIALFYLLPLHINNVLKKNYKLPIKDKIIDFVMPIIPKRGIDDLLYRPSLFIIDVFSIIEVYDNEIATLTNNDSKNV